MSEKQSPHFDDPVFIVKEIYAGINANDIPLVMKYCDPDIERIEPEGFPSSGTYIGHVKMQAHIADARNTWAEGMCKIEDIFVEGDKVVVFVHVHVRLKGSTEWLEGRIADGFIVREGKVTLMRTFIERQQALSWAGLS